MKVLFAGGGNSGGHFYPIIAIAESLNKLIEQEKLITVQLYMMADAVLDERLLFQNKIKFIRVPTGKMRRYFSIQNVLDIFKTAYGCVIATYKMYSLYPDVVIGKGGYASFPALFAARLLHIPVIIHESDTVPGKTNLWASKFATRIAVSYPGAVSAFPAAKTAHTGQPIRQEIIHPMKEGAYSLLNLEKEVPVVVILGGGQGSQTINEAVIDVLGELLERVQIIHQTGPANYDAMLELSQALLEKSPYKTRYHPFAMLNDEAMKMSAGVADLVVSRAGSTIFEIAVWGVASIIIPITHSNGDHQRKNAFAYARAGACEVIEEANFSPHILSSEIFRLIDEPQERERMGKSASAFGSTEAADKIAREIIQILEEHTEGVS